MREAVSEKRYPKVVGTARVRVKDGKRADRVGSQKVAGEGEGREGTSCRKVVLEHHTYSGSGRRDRRNKWRGRPHDRQLPRSTAKMEVVHCRPLASAVPEGSQVEVVHVLQNVAEQRGEQQREAHSSSLHRIVSDCRELISWRLGLLT